MKSQEFGVLGSPAPHNTPGTAGPNKPGGAQKGGRGPQLKGEAKSQGWMAVLSASDPSQPS